MTNGALLAMGESDCLMNLFSPDVRFSGFRMRNQPRMGLVSWDKSSNDLNQSVGLDRTAGPLDL